MDGSQLVVVVLAPHLLGLKAFSIGIAGGAMCIAYIPLVDFFDISALGQRWKCT